MSAVLRQTKQLYQKVLFAEFILLACIAGIVGIWLGFNHFISFVLGEIAGLLPHCVLVYWVFFRKSVINPQSMSIFYRGEGLKWLTTIILIVVMFKSYSEMHYLAFFCGFFFMILCNSLLPIALKWHSK